MNTIYTITGKGGAAKSTTAKYLGLVLTTAGKTVTLVDADPQGSLTRFIMGDAFTPTKTLSDLLLGNADLNEVLIKTDQGLGLIPCTSELENTAVDLAKRPANIFRLQRILETLCGIVIIDTLPKTFDYLTEMAAAASDYIIAIAHPDREAIRKIEEAKELAAAWAETGRRAKYRGFIATQLSKLSGEQRELTDTLMARPDCLGGVWWNRSQRKHSAYLHDYGLIADKIGNVG